MSEIRVDTISEKTSANGVAVDGVTLKDGAVGATGTATSVAGIPFYRGPGDSKSIYTHDVSGTDNDALFNTGYGLTALDAITTGDENVALGFAALTSLTTGTRNIAIGRQTADEFDTENDNLAIGRSALGGTVAGGEFNVAIGNYSLDALTSADNNVVIGYEAGGALTTSGENVIIGSYAVSNGVLTGKQNI